MAAGAARLGSRGDWSASAGGGDNDPVNPSTAMARVLVDELVANGVRDVVLAPGSRNAPLSMALHGADAGGRLRLHVRIDERTAGFLALGLARGAGRPAAVVTTSGTAVANLHPAVLEAAHGAVGLIVLSADRPPWLRDVGANQTIDQRAVFGGVLRMFHEFAVPAEAPARHAGWRSMVCRAVAAASGTGSGVPGPVQLNVPLVEPLLPDPDDLERPGLPADLAGRDGPWTRIAYEGAPAVAVPPPANGEKVLFVADLTHPWAARIAQAGQLVVSEAGGAGGGAVLAAGIHLLGDRPFLDSARPDRVVVLGRPTLFRSLTGLLGDPRVTVDLVAHPARFADPAGAVRAVAPGWPDLAGRPDAGWAACWRDADTAAAVAVRKVLQDLDIGHSPRLAADLVALLPAGATLVLGSSQVPRDVGMAAAARDGLRILANRGVAGIDGTVSTAVGAALAAGPGKPTYALMGDLTVLHDITGLVIGPHEPRPDLVIVVSNNDGGAIFGTLEPGRPEFSGAFERVFGTPHGVTLAGMVEGAGAEHVFVSTSDELADALADPGGIRVVEVPTSRTDLAGTQQAMRDAVARAVS